jgi:hypothetical protein
MGEFPQDPLAVDVTVAVVCFGERARTLTPFAYLLGYRGKQMGCPEVERSSLPTPRRDLDRLAASAIRR